MFNKFRASVRYVLYGNLADYDVLMGFKPDTDTEDNNMTRISTSNDGTGFDLFDNGTLIKTYSRHRDAVRGAQRRGLTFA